MSLLKPIVLDYSKIEDAKVVNLRAYDHPDYVDAFVDEATYEGRAMTDDELDVLNQDRDYVYKLVCARIYG